MYKGFLATKKKLKEECRVELPLLNDVVFGSSIG